jgi:phosphoribosylglycinamide formyltransferase-1
MPDPFRIIVLISGGGTTLKNLIEQQSAGQLAAQIVQVIASNPTARGLTFAEDARIPTVIVDHLQYRDIENFSQQIFDHCRSAQTDLVVMGGFLRRVVIPDDFVNRVINIHPSLIPAFCGSGHYGKRVHSAVIEYGCKLSGCTVHFVDDHYDHGPIIAQQSVPVLPDDTPDRLAQRVFETECEIYPRIINLIAAGQVRLNERQVFVTDS